jgi:1,4-dihydroxy-2-naphthoate octaprenyltransferase
MGYYQRPSDPPPGEEPSGCRDVFLLTRAAFGVLLLPVGILLGAILALVLILFLFSKAWWLGLLGLIAIAVGIYLYARWEQHHFRAQ